MTTLFNENLKSTFFSFFIFSLLSLMFIGCSTTEESTTPEESTEITHNGVTYNIVTSPYTSRIWLDRNLGASKVCEDINESTCFGDYYQWGRETDGHEKYDSNISNIRTSSITNIGNSFILAVLDWTDAAVDTDGLLRSAEWSKIDGTSVCPVDFRVPTTEELEVETTGENVSDNVSAFNNSFLKLPSAGLRSRLDGNISLQGDNGYIWTNSTSDDNKSFRIYFHSTAGSYNGDRASGLSVRCIKDYIPNQAPTADAGEDQNITLGESVTLSASGSSDSDGTIVSYQWQKDGVDISTDINITFSSLEVGTYTYTLVVTDDAGESSSANSVVVTINAVSTLITHNGITYGLVTSPFTDRVWLDRNMGASQVCTSFDDSDCYGDYYQWGRKTDGHEKSDSNTTNVKTINFANAGNKFITSTDDGVFDWTVAGIDDNGALRAVDWNNTTGDIVCPVGFMVPSMLEIKAETTDEDVSDAQSAFNNFLKFPSAGHRNYSDGSKAFEGVNGSVWVNRVDNNNSWKLGFSSSSADTTTTRRAYAFSVRCIQNNTPNQVPTADAGNDVSIVLGESVTLSGLASSDSDGTIMSYLWQKDSVDVGTDANLTLSSLAVGTYTYTLIVTDDDGESSSADSVVVTVSEVAVLNVGLYATGQTISQQANDDGAYLKGIVKTYTRGSDIVDDTTLHIQWQDNNSNPFVNYSDATVTCNNLSLSGYEDWRLPTIYELITIVDMSRASNTAPAVNSTFLNIAFTQGLASAYWSSTEHKAVTNTVFNLNFSHVYVDAGGIGGNMYVKCVRDTQ